MHISYVSDPNIPVQRDQKFLRSGQMVQCLREDLMYSEKRARDFLFGAVESVLAQAGSSGSEPKTVSRLEREAVLLAHQTGMEAGYEFKNWKTTGRAITKSMLLAGVLLDKNRKPIRFGISAQSAPVYGLAAEYRDTVEAYLLRHIIVRLGDVTVRDHVALAHALFRQFDARVPMDEMEERVHQLLAKLSGRLMLDETGQYRAGPTENLFRPLT